MKRGNIALKRGVALAAAFATAVAGAVVLAPSASAHPGDWVSDDNVRPTPVADAAWVDADGALADSAAVGAEYGTSNRTGVAKVLTGNNQLANGIQIVLESDTTTANWGDGETVTVTLTDAVFNTTPSVAISPLVKLNGSNSIQYLAGVAGEHATLPQVIDDSAAAKLAQSTGAALNGAKDELTITLKEDPAEATAAGQGYVITLSGVKVNVDPAADHGDEIVATVASNTAHVAEGATTIGYVGELGLSAASGSVDAGAAAPQALPDVTFSETVAAGFDNIAYTLTVSTDAAAGVQFNATPTATTSGNDSLTATVAGFSAATTGTVTLGATSATDKESVTLSGLKVQNVPADATKVIVTLTPSAGSADNGGGDFSYYPDLDALTVEVPIDRPEQRYAGDNRYETAADIAEEYVVKNSNTKVNAVVLANGLNAKDGADALAANFLGAPILLTDSSGTLPKETQDALKKILNTGAIEIFAMGKTDSVSQAARDQAAVIAYGVTGVTSVKVTEVAGDNRFATSAASADKGGNIGSFALKSGEPFLKTAFLASGTVNADALAAGSASARLDIPVLLTNGSTLDDAVADAIDDLGIQQLIILGATDRVSDAVVDAAKDAGVTNTHRIAGSDRYQTAADLYSFLVNAGTTDPGFAQTLGGTAYLASGNLGWPDALTVGPLAGLGSLGAVVTTGPGDLAPAAEKFLKDNKAALTDVFAAGGKDRVSSDALKAALDAVK